MKETISVKEAAKILGMSEQGIRIQLQRQILPIGEAIPNTKGSGFRYLIFRSKLSNFIGKELIGKSEE